MTFVLKLMDSTRTERIDDVEAFVGRDRSGSFGILARHERMMTSLDFGLARFRRAGGSWQYLAVPGALVYFHDDELELSTRHYLIDADYKRISAAVEAELTAEEAELESTKTSLRRMEEEVMKRLWRLRRD